MDSYTLSRNWFNWCFENPEMISPNHTALYFFIIEHCNRLGWKRKFGLPTTMAKEAIGIRSYNTYIKTLNDLISFGFIEMIEKSKNQYSSNIIALSKFDKAPNKALDKALIKHTTKQSESTQQSISSVSKQETRNKKQETIVPEFSEFLKYALEKEPLISETNLKLKYEAWKENGWKNGNDKPIKNWKSNLLNTIPHIEKNKNGEIKPDIEKPRRKFNLIESKY